MLQLRLELRLLSALQTSQVLNILTYAQLQHELIVNWWLDTLKRTEKIVRESAFDKKKKKPGLKLTPG